MTQGNTISVYRINPSSSAAPHLVVRGLGDAIGSDGTIYYERSDHHLVALRPNGTPPSAPPLADSPNGLGGGVQYVEVVAAGAVWVSEPAGQGLDAAYTTFDAPTLAQVGLVQRLGHRAPSSTPPPAPLVLQPAGSARPARARPDAGGLRPAHRRAGHHQRPGQRRRGRHPHRPPPAVIVSDTTTGQFDLVRLS